MIFWDNEDDGIPYSWTESENRNQSVPVPPVNFVDRLKTIDFIIFNEWDLKCDWEDRKKRLNLDSVEENEVQFLRGYFLFCHGKDEGYKLMKKHHGEENLNQKEIVERIWFEMDSFPEVAPNIFLLLESDLKLFDTLTNEKRFEDMISYTREFQTPYFARKALIEYLDRFIEVLLSKKSVKYFSGYIKSCVEIVSTMDDLHSRFKIIPDSHTIERYLKVLYLTHQYLKISSFLERKKHLGFDQLDFIKPHLPFINHITKLMSPFPDRKSESIAHYRNIRRFYEEKHFEKVSFRRNGRNVRRRSNAPIDSTQPFWTDLEEFNTKIMFGNEVVMMIPQNLAIHSTSNLSLWIPLGNDYLLTVDTLFSKRFFLFYQKSLILRTNFMHFVNLGNGYLYFTKHSRSQFNHLWLFYNGKRVDVEDFEAKLTNIPNTSFGDFLVFSYSSSSSSSSSPEETKIFFRGVEFKNNPCPFIVDVMEKRKRKMVKTSSSNNNIGLTPRITKKDDQSINEDGWNEKENNSVWRNAKIRKTKEVQSQNVFKSENDIIWSHSFWVDAIIEMYLLKNFDAITDFSKCLGNLINRVHFFDRITYPQQTNISSFSTAYQEFLVTVMFINRSNSCCFSKLSLDVIRHKILPYVPEISVLFSKYEDVVKLVEVKRLRSENETPIPTLEDFREMRRFSDKIRILRSLVITRRRLKWKWLDNNAELEERLFDYVVDPEEEEEDGDEIQFNVCVIRKLIQHLRNLDQEGGKGYVTGLIRKEICCLIGEILKKKNEPEQSRSWDAILDERKEVFVSSITKVDECLRSFYSSPSLYEDLRSLYRIEERFPNFDALDSELHKYQTFVMTNLMKYQTFVLFIKLVTWMGNEGKGKPKEVFEMEKRVDLLYHFCCITETPSFLNIKRIIKSEGKASDSFGFSWAYDKIFKFFERYLLFLDWNYCIDVILKEKDNTTQDRSKSTIIWKAFRVLRFIHNQMLISPVYDFVTKSINNLLNTILRNNPEIKKEIFIHYVFSNNVPGEEEEEEGEGEDDGDDVEKENEEEEEEEEEVPLTSQIKDDSVNVMLCPFFPCGRDVSFQDFEYLHFLIHYLEDKFFVRLIDSFSKGLSEIMKVGNVSLFDKLVPLIHEFVSRSISIIDKKKESKKRVSTSSSYQVFMNHAVDHLIVPLLSFIDFGEDVELFKFFSENDTERLHERQKLILTFYKTITSLWRWKHFTKQFVCNTKIKIGRRNAPSHFSRKSNHQKFLVELYYLSISVISLVNPLQEDFSLFSSSTRIELIIFAVSISGMSYDGIDKPAQKLLKNGFSEEIKEKMLFSRRLYKILSLIVRNRSKSISDKKRFVLSKICELEESVVQSSFDEEEDTSKEKGVMEDSYSRKKKNVLESQKRCLEVVFMFYLIFSFDSDSEVLSSKTPAMTMVNVKLKEEILKDEKMMRRVGSLFISFTKNVTPLRQMVYLLEKFPHEYIPIPEDEMRKEFLHFAIHQIENVPLRALIHPNPDEVSTSIKIPNFENVMIDSCSGYLPLFRCFTHRPGFLSNKLLLSILKRIDMFIIIESENLEEREQKFFYSRSLLSWVEEILREMKRRKEEEHHTNSGETQQSFLTFSIISKIVEYFTKWICLGDLREDIVFNETVGQPIDCETEKFIKKRVIVIISDSVLISNEGTDFFSKHTNLSISFIDALVNHILQEELEYNHNSIDLLCNSIQTCSEVNHEVLRKCTSKWSSFLTLYIRKNYIRSSSSSKWITKCGELILKTMSKWVIVCPGELCFSRNELVTLKSGELFSLNELIGFLILKENRHEFIKDHDESIFSFDGQLQQLQSMSSDDDRKKNGYGQVTEYQKRIDEFLYLLVEETIRCGGEMIVRLQKEEVEASKKKEDEKKEYEDDSVYSWLTNTPTESVLRPRRGEAGKSFGEGSDLSELNDLFRIHKKSGWLEKCRSIRGKLEDVFKSESNNNGTNIMTNYNFDKDNDNMNEYESSFMSLPLAPVVPVDCGWGWGGGVFGSTISDSGDSQLKEEENAKKRSFILDDVVFDFSNDNVEDNNKGEEEDGDDVKGKLNEDDKDDDEDEVFEF